MKRTIRPSSFGAWTMILLFAIIITLALYVIRSFLDELFIPLLIVVWGSALTLCLVAWIMRKFRTMELSDDSITMRTGILNTKTVFVPYRTITDANIRQSLIERVIGIGTLEINTAGTSSAEAIMSEIPYNDLKYIIDVLKEKEAGTNYERTEHPIRDRKKS